MGKGKSRTDRKPWRTAETAPKLSQMPNLAEWSAMTKAQRDEWRENRDAEWSAIKAFHAGERSDWESYTREQRHAGKWQ